MRYLRGSIPWGTPWGAMIPWATIIPWGTTRRDVLHGISHGNPMGHPMGYTMVCLMGGRTRHTAYGRSDGIKPSKRHPTLDIAGTP